MRTGRQERGLTLVGLLVGTALVLLVAAACGLLVVGHWREARSQLVEARLTQDLRSAADLMSRSLRRAGYWGDAGASRWQPGAWRPFSNPYAGVASGPCDTPNVDEAAYCLSRDASENGSVDDNEQFGFRRNPGNAAQIDMKLGRGNWQALTDPTSLRVTDFRLRKTIQDIDLESLCALPCAPGDAACPPRQQIVVMSIDITAAAAADPGIVRRASVQVRRRSDGLSGACEG